MSTLDISNLVRLSCDYAHERVPEPRTCVGR
jgi:hypothetical protein